MASVTNSTPHSDEREVFAAYVCDDLSKQVISEAAEKAGLSPNMVFKGGIAASVRALGAMTCPQILYVDLSESSNPLGDMQALAEVCEEDTLVVALGTVNDVTLYRELLSVGVEEYLVKPVSPDLIAASLGHCIEVMNTAPEEETESRVVHSRQILVMGTRGGLGTSMVASNLAWLSAEEKINTVLLDMDPFFGTAAMNFDLEPGRGLPDALDNPARVDGLFLERAVIKPRSHLSVLASEAPIGMIPDPQGSAVETLINAMGDNFDCVYVDVPRQFLATHPELLAAATDIVLVTDLSLTSARDCIRLMAQFKNLAPDAVVHLVANRVGPVNEVVQRDFENSIEADLNLLLPEDRKGMIAAAQKGKVMLETAPNSKFSVAIRQLFTMVHEEESDSETNGGWFKKLLGR